tara:strand:- start:1494 stop:2804 length:1311 start_codon:yes stop_codon:yes gene_type:complete
MIVSGFLFAQNSPIDFETGGYGATWTWAVFENDNNPSLEIVANPNTDSINSSATVAKFTALQAGQPWAGCESQHGSDIGTFTLNATNSTLKIMVYKTVISDVGLKFVIPSSGSLGEIKVANTLINAWEELTFDFSSHIGLPEAIGIDQIVVFPDFNLSGRTQDNIIYFDNISFSPATVPGSPTEAAPTPTLSEANVISIFSDAYTNIAGVNLNPAWGQSTVVTEMTIEGNNTLLYTGLNYQGTEFTAQDVSGMTYLHIDYWTDNSTMLKFFVISQTPTVDSDYHTIAIVTEEWASVDIPLTTFPNVDLTDVFQFKVEGNGTIYWDNFYFYSNSVGIDNRSESLPQKFALEQNFPNPFNPSTTIGYELPENGLVNIAIYDITGRHISTLVSNQQKAGYKSITWNATNDAGSPVSAGLYLLAIQAGEFRQTKKMVLLK